MKIAGHIDRCDETVIEGWLAILDRPSEKPLLYIKIGATVIGQCTADRLRPDLAAAGIGDGCHGFFFKLPAFLPKSEVSRIKVVFPGTPLCLENNNAAETKPERPTLSRFGGLWIDRYDWIDELALRHRCGEISDELSHLIFQFVRDGYVVLKAAVPPDKVEQANQEIEQLYNEPPEWLLIETWEPDRKLKYITAKKEYRTGQTKLLDVYAVSPLIRGLTASPKVIEFLTAIFEAKPKAFQGLYFHRGSEQDIHKDTAYVKVDTNPMHLAATWLALEDVQPGTGELEYYVGSHRAPDFLFADHHKWMESNPDQHVQFLQSLHADAEKYKQVRSSFLGKAGDVLVWHADLAHGGARIAKPGQTRKSLVTHFTTVVDEPYYRRNAQHQALESDTCAFVSNYADVL